MGGLSALDEPPCCVVRKCTQRSTLLKGHKRCLYLERVRCSPRWLLSVNDLDLLVMCGFPRKPFKNHFWAIRKLTCKEPFSAKDVECFVRYSNCTRLPFKDITNDELCAKWNITHQNLFVYHLFRNPFNEKKTPSKSQIRFGTLSARMRFGMSTKHLSFIAIETLKQ